MCLHAYHIFLFSILGGGEGEVTMCVQLATMCVRESTYVCVRDVCVRDVPAGADLDSRRVERKKSKIDKERQMTDRESKCGAKGRAGKRECVDTLSLLHEHTQAHPHTHSHSHMHTQTQVL